MNQTPVERHALVTGGSRGIGYAVAESLLDQGARVTLMGRNEDALKAAADNLSDHGRVAYACGDISQQAAVRQAVDTARSKFGLISILVNNAGQAVSERFDRLDQSQWDSMIGVNLTGTFHCIQAVLGDMTSGGWGRIVNVASTAGLTGYPYVSAYCAAKHGVVGLTRALALELARKGITVNAVCPGYTDTDLVFDAVQNIMAKTAMTKQQAIDSLAARNPQRRLVQPQEVAATVAWLCQSRAASVNGQAIAVDGGEVMTG